MPMVAVKLTPQDIVDAFQEFSYKDKKDTMQLFNENFGLNIDIDPRHNLPKSFVADIKEGLAEIKKGNYSRDSR
ncbi:MAG: hypothetical protein QME81_07950 [bacterium]|nr:hypothetical protein [bacterium]